MAAKSHIQWTDATWTPVRARVKADAAQIARDRGYTSLVQILEARKPNGELRSPPGKVGPHCEHVSAGCENCYSETNNGRCLPANGTGLPFDRRSRDLVDIFLDEKILVQPLHWRAPRRVFVCSQTDLFGEFVTAADILAVFQMMGKCPAHTFQVLTKRSARMLALLKDRHWRNLGGGYHVALIPGESRETDSAFLPNVHLGVSVEDQPTADERSAHLRATPAAVRFISQEPQLSAIDWKPGMLDGIHWVIIGGESGPRARPFDIALARKTIAQCRAAKVAVFVKQLGARPFADHEPLPSWPISVELKSVPLIPCDGLRDWPQLKDRKGGSMEEWPADLRVREEPR